MIQLQVLNYILNNSDPSFITTNNLKAEYFSEFTDEFNYIKNHIHRYGNVPDKATFLDTFPDFELLDGSESPTYLLDELIKDYKTRHIAKTFNSVKNLLLSGNIEEAERLFKASANDLSGEMSLNALDLFADTSIRYDEYLDRVQNPNKYYISTGFKELDKAIGGIDLKEELGVIMARTNMGKSYIGLKMAIAAAAQGYKVGLYSGEMTCGKVGYRFDTILSHIPNGSLSHGNINVQLEYKKYLDELKEKYPNASLRVFTREDYNGPIGVSVMEAFMDKYDLDILFIDQLSLLDDDRHGRTNSERQSNIIIDLKKLQVRKKKPIIAIAQQNRTTNEDGSVDTTQIAGSDDIGKYATFVIAITRDKKDETILRLEVTKCRDGKVGTKLTYFADLSVATFIYIPEEGEDDGSNQGEPEYINEDCGEDAF